MVCVVQVIKCGLVTHIKLLRSFCKCRAVTYSYLQATHAKPFGEMTTIWMYPNSPFRCLHLSASLSWQRFFTTVFHCEYPRVEILFLCTRCCDSAARARWENRLWQIPWREFNPSGSCRPPLRAKWIPLKLKPEDTFSVSLLPVRPSLSAVFFVSNFHIKKNFFQSGRNFIRLSADD